MFQQLLCQMFSNQCQLTYLRLDIRKSSFDIHQCLKSNSHHRLNTVADGFQSYCLTLRRLQIHLDYTCFLEDLIEHVPNLEQLLVYCQQLQRHYIYSNSCVHGSIPSNGNWFNKVR